MTRYHLICFLSLFLACPVFAHEGGQTGSGGNGCWLYWEGGYTWKTVEELSYINSFGRYRSREYTSKVRFSSKISFKRARPQDITIGDLARSRPYKDGLDVLKTLRDGAPHVHAVMMDLTNLFKYVHVLHIDSHGSFEADYSSMQERCEKFSPAMLTFNDGTIIVFRPIWNRVESVSMTVLYVHETLRFAQMFHPAFKDLSNAELQAVSSYMFDSSKKKDMMKILGRFEKRLSTHDYPVTLENEVPENLSHEMFNAKLTEALRENRSLSEAINELRMKNPVFMSLVLDNLGSFIQNKETK